MRHNDSFNEQQAETQLPKKLRTSDGLEFIINTSDVIDLTEEQFNTLAAIMIRRKAEYIRRDGIDIASLNPDQTESVLREIEKRIGMSENPLQDDLIRISKHIRNDHVTNPGVLQSRGWYRDTVDEIYTDIVNVIKEASSVRKAIIKFRKQEEITAPKFTFTIVGVKVNGDLGEVSIAFIEAEHDLILAVTII